MEDIPRMLDFSSTVSVMPTITMRPYQQTCIERVLAVYQQRPHGGKTLIVLPTGGGKTIVFVEIARQLGLNTLIIAHRQELLQQAADKFLMVDPLARIGQVGAGRHEYGAPITIASVQTISRPEHLKALQRFGYGLVIIDECHHSAAAGYQAVLDALPNAFVLGVTATPDRLDKQSVEGIFGEPVFKASIIDMVEQGYLCDLRAIAVRTSTSLDSVHTQAGDFNLEELEEVIDTPERNQRIVTSYLEHCRGRQSLCFAVTIAHAENLATAFQKAGVKAAVVSSETPPEQRKHILHDYERGELEVVCNCGVLTEGYDAPQTSCVIMARPTKSRALFVQCIGRGTRLAPGKQDCIILDITDNCLRHRIEPITLNKALGKLLLDGESITEAKEREEREKKERTARISQRGHDLAVNILARMDWQRQKNGTYLLEIGSQKHAIMLIPSDEKDGYYSVWAKLAPTFTPQQWVQDAPLTWAQEHAEIKARLLQSDEKKVILVDSTAPWRVQPASIKQIYLLRKFGIEHNATITSGEASDLIGKEMDAREKRKAEKKTAKASKSTKRTRVSAQI